jgi:hypothetical protein
MRAKAGAGQTSQVRQFVAFAIASSSLAACIAFNVWAWFFRDVPSVSISRFEAWRCFFVDSYLVAVFCIALFVAALVIERWKSAVFHPHSTPKESYTFIHEACFAQEAATLPLPREASCQHTPDLRR